MKLYKAYILFTLLNFSVFASLFSQSLNQNPVLIKGQLDNGLTYYVYPNNTPKGEAVYRLFIKSGSVFEEDSQKGLAHFLEHMAFNGSKHFPGNAMIRFLESKGAKFGKDLNAHTSYNETVYKLQLPSSDPLVVDSTMTILADWAGGLLLDSIEIEKERGVIMSEWLSKTGPKYEAQNVLLNELLNNSRYADRLVIGDTAIIKNFRHQEIRDYYNKWYDPSLMAVAVVGDIDAETIKQQIHKKFGKLPSQMKGQTIPIYNIPPYTSMQAKKIVDESLDKIELIGIQILPKLRSIKIEADYAQYLQRLMLNQLLNSRMSALTFDNPPYKKGNIAISGFLNTASILMTSVELTPTKINNGINAFANDIEQIYRYGFISLEIEKTKKNYLASLRRKAELDSPAKSTTLMNEIYSDFYNGHMIITPKDEYRLAKKYITQIDSISLLRYMNQTFDWDKTHFILSAFDKVNDELPSDKQIKDTFEGLKQKKILPYSKIVDVPDKLLDTIPKAGTIMNREYISEIDAYRLHLSNGAQVIFKASDYDKNKIILSGFRKGGLYALDSTDYVNGLFAGNVIALSGAGEFSRDAINHRLAGNTASIVFRIAKMRTGLLGSCTKADLETLFQLLYLKWTQPKVDSLIFNQLKEKAIESYLTSNKTESEKFYRDLSYIFQGKNYTNKELTDSIIENELILDRIIPTFDHLLGTATGSTFVIVGDCTIDDLEPYISQYLAALPTGDPNVEYKFERENISINNITFERHTGESPHAIVNLVFQQNEIDGSLQKQNLLNEILKSVLRMKLLESLREEMGMVYSVSVSAGSTKLPSPLSRQTITFTTASENVDKLINRIFDDLRLMVDSPSSFESELADVKTNLIKNMKLDIQKNLFWSSYIRNAIFNDEPDWNYILQYDEIVNNITTDDIAKIINKNLLNSQSKVRAVLYPMKNNKKQ